MMFDWTYYEAIEKADHLKAVGETRIYLRKQEPRWELITRVEAGCAIRCDVPTGVYLVGEQDGLTLLWDVEFEPREANGSGQHQWQIGYLRDVVGKLRPEARLSFAALLAERVIPEMTKRTDEYRDYLRTQEASEMGARALLAFCSAERK